MPTLRVVLPAAPPTFADLRRELACASSSWLVDPPVRARCDGTDLPLGTRLTVELVSADPATRTVVFRPA